MAEELPGEDVPQLGVSFPETGDTSDLSSCTKLQGNRTDISTGDTSDLNTCTKLQGNRTDISTGDTSDLNTCRETKRTFLQICRAGKRL